MTEKQRTPGSTEGVVHYITTNGIGNAWVAAELQIVEEAGVPVRLHSMRAPGRHFFGSDWAKRWDADTELIYPLPPPGMLISVLLAPFLFGSRFFAGLFNALFGERENGRARIACLAHFFVACHWARGLRKAPPALIHSQWIQSCGSIGMYGAWLLGAPFSFTGHAVDLFRERVALKDKIRRAEFIVCISEFHRAFYLENGARPEQLFIVHCGIDVDQLAFKPKEVLQDPPHIISLGRLVEKKGFHDLIDACALLAARQVPVRCTIAGDGPMEEELRAQIAKLGVEDVVNLTGKALLQEELTDFLYEGDIFAQPCVWSHDNDVDGTPRTLMEAMACGIPSVSTRLAGIPDILEHDVAGLLVEPGDVEGLADALERLVTDAALRARFVQGGRAQIEREWKLPDCVFPLVTRYRQMLGTEPDTESS